MNIARQSTAKSFLIGPILDEDGAAVTDEVVASIKVTKNGSVGAANGSSTLTHSYTGHYVYAANAGDVDTLGEVEFFLNSGTNACAPIKFQVVTANIYDTMCSTDQLDVNVTNIEGSDATDQIRDAVVDDSTRIDASALNTLSGHDPGATIAKAGDEMDLVDDAITLAKFDESTAFPLAKADSGSDELARTGADGDTLEDLSDQIDDIPTNSELADAFTEIKGATWSSVTDTLEMLYDGAINNQLVTSTVGGKVDDVKNKTDNLPSDPADQSAVEAAITAAHSTTDGLITTTDAVVDLIYGIVNSGTFGNSALKTLIDLCSTHSAADVKTAMEADNSDLDYLVTDLINKKKITILSGATVQYNDSDVSIGTISAAYDNDGTDVVRKRMVQVK